MSRADLQGRGIRPYDEKVGPRMTLRATSLRQLSSSALASIKSRFKVTSILGHAPVFYRRDRDIATARQGLA